MAVANPVHAAGALYAALKLLEASDAGEHLVAPVGAVDLIGHSVLFSVNGIPFWADIRTE